MPNNKLPVSDLTKDLITTFNNFVNRSGKEHKKNVADQAKFSKRALDFQKSFVKMGKQGVQWSSDLGKSMTNNLKVSERFQKTVAGTNKLFKQTAAHAKQMNAGGGRSGGSTGLGQALGMRAFTGPMVGMAIVGALIGAISSHMTTAVDTYVSTGKAKRQLAGVVKREQMDAVVAAAASTGAGFGPVDTINQMVGMARATGSISGVATAQDKARFAGMSPEEMTPFMGLMAQSSGDSNFSLNSKQNRILGEVMHSSVASGLTATRTPEFLQGMSQVLQRQGRVAAGTVDVAATARALSMLGAIGPGGQGARGGALFNQLDQAFIGAAKGGGSKESQALIYQALGYGLPGGQRSFMEATYQAEKGATDPENIKALLSYTKGMFGNTDYGAHVLSYATGVSATQSKALLEMQAGGASEKDMKAEIDRLSKEARPDMEKMLEITEHAAGMQRDSLKAGEDLFKKVSEIQAAIQKFVLEFTGLVKELLEAVGGLLKAINTVASYVKRGFKLSNTEGQAYGENFQTYKELSKGMGIPEQSDALKSQGTRQRRALQSAKNALAAEKERQAGAPELADLDRIKELQAEVDRTRALGGEISEEVKKLEQKKRVANSKQMLGEMTGKDPGLSKQAMEEYTSNLFEKLGALPVSATIDGGTMNSMNNNVGSAHGSTVSVDATAGKK